MTRWIAAGLILTMVSGCATVRDSVANPFNWFGRSSSEPVTTAEGAVNPLIPRRSSSVFRTNREEAAYNGSLVAQVSELRVDRFQGGAVVKATGIATSLGAFDVRLVEQPRTESSTLTFEMRVLQPRASRGRGSSSARTVTAGVALSEQDLLGVRSIRVVSAGNARVTRR